ncbi:MAG: hypothetical protein JWQ38_275 [Flavipsychrobacter sp.]|nr:hypothetical protein [Flavipsychrobacter sp.]
MKKLLILITIALATSACYADEIKYCEINVYQPAFKRYIVEVNYMGSHKRKFTPIKDNNTGKNRRFESRLDAVNYFIKDGWEVVSATIVPHSSGETRYYMKKA